MQIKTNFRNAKILRTSLILAPVIVGKDLSEINQTCAWSTLMLITGHCFLKRKHFRAKKESLKQFSLRQHSVKNHNQISQMESWGMRWTCHDCHSSIGCLQLLHAKDFSCYWFWWSRLMDTSPHQSQPNWEDFLTQLPPLPLGGFSR